jgi:hypothetical protein
MLINGWERNTFQGCFLPNFDSFGQAVTEGKIQWRPCLLTDLDEMSNLYRRPSIDDSYQISVHLSKRFQRRRFFKSANQKQKLSMVAMFVNGLILELNVQSL